VTHTIALLLLRALASTRLCLNILVKTHLVVVPDEHKHWGLPSLQLEQDLIERLDWQLPTGVPEVAYNTATARSLHRGESQA
jgi:hypothetical protein